MKRIRKRLAWLLAMAMLLTALPVGALAEEKNAPAEETPLCTCETVCSADAVNTECPICGAQGAAPENCGQYQAPEQDGAGEGPEDAAPQEPTAAEQVQTLISALPTAEALADMDTEGQQAVYADLQDAYDAYEALSDDEKQEVTGAEIFDTLFGFFNGMTNALADSAFNITGDTANADYTYSNGVLTVKNGANLTVSMADGATTPTSDRIVVESNASASITLNGVNIKGTANDGSATKQTSAITLSPDSSLTLTLAQGSSNTLAGGSGGANSAGAPAINVPEGTTLTVLCSNEDDNDHICGENCGSLSATGGSAHADAGGVGIGGGIQGSSGPGSSGPTIESCGVVLLLGGNLTVSGGSGNGNDGNAVDIGGANNTAGTGGAGGTVIILTDVTSSDNTLTVGGGTGFAASDNGAGIRPSTGDNAYEVYGSLSLPADLTIPAGVTVTIPENTTLTVPSGTTLTNNGAITGAGTLNGDGRIQGTGTISVTNNNFKTELEIKVKKNGADATQFYYGDVITVEVTPKLTSGTVVTNGISALSSTNTPTVSMSYNGIQLASTTEKDSNGTYTLSYDTSNKGLFLISNLSLDISFSGGDNMAASSGNAAITLSPKPVTASVSGEVTKVYDQNTSITLPLTLTDIVQGDEITATVTGTFADSQVGDNNTVTLGTLETSGADKAWYTVTCTQTSVTGSITPAALGGAVTIDTTGGVTPGRTLTATYTKASETSDETVSYQWNRDGAAISGATETTYTITAEDEGQQITVTATASDANHTGSVTSQAVTAGNRPVVGITGVTAQNGIYDGQSHTGYTGTPANSDGYTGEYRVTYSGRGSTTYPDSSNPPTNAGDYYVTFELADTTAYTGNLQVPFSISKRSLVLQAEDKAAAVGTVRPELTYVISGDGLVIGENLTTEPTLTCDADMSRAGTYPITVSGAAASDNYEISYQDGTLDVKPLSIENAEVTLSPSEYTYDGSPKIPSVTVVLNGSTLSEDTDYTVASYKDNTTPGTATVTVTGKGNYTGEATGEFTIKMEVPMISKQPVGQTYKMSEWQEKQAEALTVEAGVSSGTLSYQWYSNDTNSAENSTVIENATEKNYTPDITNVGTTYYYCVVTNTLNGYTATKTSDIVEITVKDDIPPIGDIKIKENSVKTLISKITFGLFFKENIDVTITAEDNESGVKGIAYYRSEKVLTEQQLNALPDDDWTKASDSASCKLTETAQDAEKFIYYVRITDNAGNVTLFASDGVTFDTTVPMFSGIEDGKTYCSAVEVTVSEANLDKVTVNGQTAAVTDGKFTVSPAEGAQTIAATDKAGNTTSISVTVNDGHAWGKVSYEWAKTENGYTVTAKRTCTVDSAHRDTATATAVGTVTTPAACTEKGKTTYKAAFDVDWASPQETTIADISPKGHTLTGCAAKAATCTATGSVAYWHCSECEKNFDAEENGKELQTVETPIDSSNHNPATAWTQENGKHYHVCQNGCGTHLEEAACSGGTATCTAQAVCEVCQNAYGEKDLDNHTGDTEVRDAQEATCTADGYTGDTYCKACNTKLQTGSLIPAKGHKYVYREAVSAECEKSGMAEHYTCENCSLIFDKDKQVTTAEDLTISSTGHTFSAKWKTDEEKHWRECSCGARTEEAAHTFQWKIDKDAEVGIAGTKHEECTVCGYAKAAVEIPALEAPKYPPVIGDTDGGQVAVNPENPQAGEKVTITAKPEEGKAVDKVVVTDADGKEISVTDNGDGTYIFLQPDGEVTIKVTFKTEKEEENRPTTTPEPTTTPTSTPSADEKSPQTSDSSDIMMWRMLLLAAGVGLAGTTIYSCRKRKYSK